MTVVAVEEFPIEWHFNDVKEFLLENVKTRFKVIDIAYAKNKNYKRCFIKLPPNTDANYVIKCIKKIELEPFGYLKSHVVTGKLPCLKHEYISNIQSLTPDEILLKTHYNICLEMLHKYTGLEKLSEKTSHLLLDRLAYLIFKRLQLIIGQKPHDADTCFKLSRIYRKLYPHFADFQCIVANLHHIESKGTKSEVTEADLIKVPSSPYTIEGVPSDEVKKSSDKFTDIITKTITEHINSLDVEMSDETTDTDSAKEEVIRELHNLTPYLPYMVKNTFSHYLDPKEPKDSFINLRDSRRYLKSCQDHVLENDDFHETTGHTNLAKQPEIYGIPFLPPKNIMQPFTVRYCPVSVTRCPYMYNLIELTVKPAYYGRLVAADGTLISGANLVIRPVQTTIKWKVPSSLKAEMREFYGVRSDKVYEDKHNFRDVVDDVIEEDVYELQLF